MDVFKFRKQRNRICASSNNCSICPLLKFNHCNNFLAVTDDDEFARLVEVVESWAKEHPLPTRQSKFLKAWPDTYLDVSGVIDICPCVISKSRRDENGGCAMLEINCLKCKKDFWLKEIEEVENDE